MTNSLISSYPSIKEEFRVFQEKKLISIDSNDEQALLIQICNLFDTSMLVKHKTMFELNFRSIWDYSNSKGFKNSLFSLVEKLELFSSENFLNNLL